jgi:pilus assembly protein CpaB
MRPRTILVAFLAIALAGATALYARSWLQNQQASVATATVVEPAAEMPPPPPPAEVLVAAFDLPAGVLVKPEDLRWQAWPVDSVPPSYVVKGRRDIGEFAGAVVRRGLGLGEPVTDSLLVRPGDRGFLAAVLDPGKRAISVPVNSASGNAGLIFPGDRVDLILTHRIGDGEVGRLASETVLQDVRVIAIDQKVDDQQGAALQPRTATLEVTPKEAEVVSVVLELGKLSLSLRSLAKGDRPDELVFAPRVMGDRAGLTWDSDVSGALLRAPAAPRPSRQVTIVRGRSAETLDFNGRATP